MTQNNHWVFTKCETESEKQLAKDLHIPEKVIAENGGMFLIDFTRKTPNYQDLSKHNLEKLNHQLEETSDIDINFYTQMILDFKRKYNLVILMIK